MMYSLKLAQRWLKWLGFLTLIIGTGGCWSVQQPQTFHYDVTPAVLAAGPPTSAGQGIISSPNVVANEQIKIQPSTAPGYENLPPAVKELYGPSPLKISLSDVINQTLAHDRAIRIQQYLLNVDEAQVSVAKGIYDVLLTASASAAESIQQSASELSGSAPRRTRGYNIGLSQLLPTGATLELSNSMNRVNQVFKFSSLNPTVTAAATASIRQPLLKGFGPAITNVNIHIAQTNRQASAADFEGRVQDQLLNAVNLYYDLLFAVRVYDVQVISYLAALDLQRINSAKVAAGVLAPTEELQAKASAEARREAVLTARQAVRDAEDRLKQQMFFQDNTPAWELELLPTQDLVWREVEINPQEILAEAMDERPEVRAGERRLTSRGFSVAQAADARKPQLDVLASRGLTGLDSGGRKALNFVEGGQFDNNSIGLQFSVPFQNRAARFAHQQQIDLQLSEVEKLAQTKDQVTFDVRVAIRGLKIGRERIDIARARVESEQANLDAERKRFDVGVSTSFQVLQFQENLANAQDAYIQAVVSYNKAGAALEHARGTMAKSYGISIDAPNLNPQSERIIFPIGFQ